MTIAGVELAEYGDTMRIEGVIVGDGHKRRFLYLPGEYRPLPAQLDQGYSMTLDETLDWLKQSDDPTSPIYSDDLNKVIKAVVRKATRQVDQNVAWTCYKRDNFVCRYCSKSGVPLTYDHFQPQALGGLTTVENGRSACRPCNKAKGHMTIDEWTAFQQKRGLGGML